jgi:hypothetical protein
MVPVTFMHPVIGPVGLDAEVAIHTVGIRAAVEIPGFIEARSGRQSVAAEVEGEHLIILSRECAEMNGYRRILPSRDIGEERIVDMAIRVIQDDVRDAACASALGELGLGTQRVCVRKELKPRITGTLFPVRGDPVAGVNRVYPGQVDGSIMLRSGKCMDIGRPLSFKLERRPAVPLEEGRVRICPDEEEPVSALAER